MAGPVLHYSSIRPSRRFWPGFAVGLCIAAIANAVPYVRTHGAYVTDGWELIGFPFVFHIRGGFSDTHRFLWAAFAGDAAVALIAGAMTGVLSATRIAIVTRYVTRYLGRH